MVPRLCNIFLVNSLNFGEKLFAWTQGRVHKGFNCKNMCSLKNPNKPKTELFAPGQQTKNYYSFKLFQECDILTVNLKFAGQCSEVICTTKPYLSLPHKEKMYWLQIVLSFLLPVNFLPHPSCL